jgi:trehalose/maltose transport system substrate-binding protein
LATSDVTQRRIDRRRLITGAAATAVAVSLPGRATVARAAESGTITVSTWSFAQKPLQPIVDKFTADTGIKVVWADNPSAGGDQVTQLTPQFASGSTPIDVLSASDEATPTFLRAGWLMPLDDLLPAGFWDDFPQAMTDYTKTWSTLDGKTYRVPHGWEYGYYWVRQDLLDEWGVAAPASWDDLLALQAKASANKMYAFGDAASQPSLAFVYAAYLASQSGGDVFAFDDGTRQAYAFAKELIDKGVFPKDALNWTYDQSNAAYMNNQLVTMRQWSFFYDVARGNKAWFAEDKAVIVLPPAGPKQRGTWAGAWGWTIPTATKVPDQAKQFLTYITAPDQALACAKALTNFISPRKSILAGMPDSPFVKLQGQYSDAGVVTLRPFNVRVAEAQSVVDSTLSGYLSGQYDLDKAMATGKSEIEALKE